MSITPLEASSGVFSKINIIIYEIAYIVESSAKMQSFFTGNFNIIKNLYVKN